MKLTELTDIELVKKYNEAKDKVDSVWSGNCDGSYEAAWEHEVVPYLLEMERRGII